MVARHEDQGRDKTLERIPPDEQGGFLAFLKMQDADCDLEQFVLAGLEQLIAGIGLENIDQRLAVMAGGPESGAFDDPGDPAAQQRDFLRALVVGDRGEQAEEPVLSDHPTLGIEALDADRIQRHRSVHGGDLGRLHDVQQAGGQQELAHVLGQLTQLPQTAEHADVGVAQDPEAGPVDDLHFLLRTRTDIVVDAGAQEGEMVVLDPPQEGQHLVHVAIGGCGRRRLDPGDHIDHGLAHGAPVLDRIPHIAQHAGNRFLDTGQNLGIVLLRNLQVHEGFR